MRCPFCSHEDTQVVDTRSNPEANVIRRRRRCPGCDKRFTTYEKVELRLPRLPVGFGGDGTGVDNDGVAERRRLRVPPHHLRFEAVEPAPEGDDLDLVHRLNRPGAQVPARPWRPGKQARSSSPAPRRARRPDARPRPR